MTTEKVWRIEKLEVTSTEDGTQVVTSVHWECTGTDGTFLGRVFKMIDLDLPDFENFTNYNDLTESQVIEWVHVKMTPEIVQYWEKIVEIQIEKQRNPKPVEPDLPWKTNS